MSGGAYRSFFAVVPEFGIGFSVLTAAQKAGGKVKDDLPNVIVNALFPVLDQIAEQQSNQNFGGQYTLADSNTTVRITTDGALGLKVTEYVSNGVDILDTVFGLFGEDIDFRLKPNHLYYQSKVGFSGVYQPPQRPLPDGSFYWDCQTWLDVDDFTYGSVPLGQFVFEVDDKGRACSVELKALRQKLTRIQVGSSRCGV